MSNDKNRFSTNERYELVLDNCEDYTKYFWRDYASASGIANSTEHVVGTKSISFDKTQTDTPSVYLNRSFNNPMDLSPFVPNGLVSFYLYVPAGAGPQTSTSFEISFNGSDPLTDYATFFDKSSAEYLDASYEGIWTRFTIRLDKFVAASGDFDLSSVHSFSLATFLDAAVTTVSGFMVDDIRVGVPDYTLSLDPVSSSGSASSVSIKNGTLSTEANVGAANEARTTASKVLLTQQVGADGTVPPTGSLNTNSPFFKLTDGSDDLDILASTATFASRIIPTKLYDNSGNAITSFGGGLTSVVGGVVVSGSQTASTSTSASTMILPVKIVDSAGNSQPAGNSSTAPIYTMDIGGGGGGGGGSMLYMSPTDFTASYSTSSGVVLTGMPYTPRIEQFASLAVTKADGTTSSYSRTTNPFSFTDLTTSGVLSVGGASFSSSDLGYLVMVYGPDKAYNKASDATTVIEASPSCMNVLEESLVDTTNVAAGENYYPSADGMLMTPYRNLSINGQITNSDATSYYTLQITNDEDSTAASRIWVGAYGYRVDANTTVSGVAVASTTDTFHIDYDAINAKYVRCKVTCGDSTNTVVLKARRTI